ncbi:MAG: hypothetical protein ACTSXZ_01995, partial [Alphaproteobacteria bacterium]
SFPSPAHENTAATISNNPISVKQPLIATPPLPIQYGYATFKLHKSTTNKRPSASYSNNI